MMPDSQNTFRRFALSGRLRFFLFSKLPAAWLAGIKLAALSPEASEVRIKHTWWSTNPFGSIYFAVLCMAGEFASGILAMQHIYKSDPAISILVVGLEAGFFKKAKGTIRFICKEGESIQKAIAEARETGNGVAIPAVSEGFDEENNLVARFTVTWSFKVKQQTA